MWNITPNRWNSRFNILDKEYLTCECIVERYRCETGNKTFINNLHYLHLFVVNKEIEENGIFSNIFVLKHLLSGESKRFEEGGGIATYESRSSLPLLRAWQP